MPRRSPKLLGNICYAGNDQIRLRFEREFVFTLFRRIGEEGRPFRFLSYSDAQGHVHILPTEDPKGENQKARTISGSGSWRSVTSWPLALQLWRIAPQGRSFTARIQQTPEGLREAVIAPYDVEQEFTYLRLEPGNPFRDPLEHVLAGKREQRRREGRKYDPDEDLYQSRDRYNEIDQVVRTINKSHVNKSDSQSGLVGNGSEKTEAESKPDKNDLTERLTIVGGRVIKPEPTWFGYETDEAAREAIKSAMRERKQAPLEAREYMERVAAYNDYLSKQEVNNG